MLLSFSTKFKNGTPTNFIEKIWNFLIISDKYEEYGEWLLAQKKLIPLNGDLAPKLHSIRVDQYDRWQAGRMIHPVINNRSKDQFQFAPTFPCVSTQNIEIKYDDEETRPEIYVDGKELTIEQHEALSVNDGFPSVWEFYAWFDEDYTGKIIHWTNLKY